MAVNAQFGNASPPGKESYLRFIAPRFFIEVDGKMADGLIPHVAKYAYKDAADKADELTITLNNKGLLFQDDFRFSRGSKIRTRFGYPGYKMSNIKTLIVVEAGFRVDSELPVFEIKAHDADRTRMTLKDFNAKVSAAYESVGSAKPNETKAKNWGFVTSSEIASILAKQYNLKVDIENSDDARKQFRVQGANVNDYELLGQLAKNLNWDFYIEAGKLHFHRRRMNLVADSANYTYYVDYTGEVLQFNAELKLKKPGKSGKAGVDPQTGETVAAETNSAGATPPNSSAGEYAILSLNQGGVYYPTPETSIPVTVIQAKAKQGKNDLDGLTSHANLVGDPKLASKRMLNINGVGKTYGGRWYIHEANHVINADGQVYTTECELKRNLVGKGKKEDKVADPAKTTSGQSTAADTTVTLWNAVGGVEALDSAGEAWSAGFKK